MKKILFFISLLLLSGISLGIPLSYFDLGKIKLSVNLTDYFENPDYKHQNITYFIVPYNTTVYDFSVRSKNAEIVTETTKSSSKNQFLRIKDLSTCKLLKEIRINIAFIKKGDKVVFDNASSVIIPRNSIYPFFATKSFYQGKKVKKGDIIALRTSPIFTYYTQYSDKGKITEDSIMSCTEISKTITPQHQEKNKRISIVDGWIFPDFNAILTHT